MDTLTPKVGDYYGLGLRLSGEYSVWRVLKETPTDMWACECVETHDPDVAVGEHSDINPVADRLWTLLPDYQEVAAVEEANNKTEPDEIGQETHSTGWFAHRDSYGGFGLYYQDMSWHGMRPAIESQAEVDQLVELLRRLRPLLPPG